MEQWTSARHQRDYMSMDDMIAAMRPLLGGAWDCEKAGKLDEARAIYNQKLAGGTNGILSIFCRQGVQRCNELQAAFPHDREALWTSMRGAFPALTRERFDSYLEKKLVVSRIVNDKTRYENANVNICFRDQWAREQNPKFMDDRKQFFKILEPWIMAKRGEKSEWIPYQLALRFSASLKDIPPGDILRLWFPFPLEKPGMTDIRVVSVSPENALKIKPDLNGELGVAYLEVPRPDAEVISSSINLSFKTRQIAHRINYKREVNYDTNSVMYRNFTRSARHTTISPEIAALARKLTAGEKYPLAKVRIIYDHILDNYHYSYNSAWRATIFSPFESASEIVLKLGEGDCATQACFFTALCRSIGIPARVTGGRVFITNEINDDHFWAEFFVPGEGWIPVDTTFPIVLLLTPGLTAEQSGAIRNYYFGCLDPFRLVTHRNELHTSLEPPKQSERRREAFLATFGEAECGGRNVNKTRLEYIYTR